MPHIPDSRHSDHDPLAIAAYAAGDATGDELDTAIALVAACADCAALHADLRAISAALPELPAPARPRDFRLTPEQAASIRPAGWRRFLAPLAGPKFAFAGPLGGGLAAMGIAGLLVAGSLGAPIAATPAGGSAADASPAVLAMEAPSLAAPSAAAAAPEAQPLASGEPLAAGNDGDVPASGTPEYLQLDPNAAPVDTTGEYGTGMAGGAPAQPAPSNATRSTTGEVASVPDNPEALPLADAGASQIAPIASIGAALVVLGLAARRAPAHRAPRRLTHRRRPAALSRAGAA